MLALFEKRGRLKVGDTVQSEGLLGSGTFEGTLVCAARVGPYGAIVPRIKGKANLIGFAKWLLDPADPLNEGFVVR